jgi:hypothetical protein
MYPYLYKYKKPSYFSWFKNFWFYFVPLRCFCFSLLISRSFLRLIFSWLGNFLVLFRFILIFLLHFAYFLVHFCFRMLLLRFDVKLVKSCLFSLPSETKFLLLFQFSLLKQKRGCTYSNPIQNPLSLSTRLSHSSLLFHSPPILPLIPLPSSPSPNTSAFIPLPSSLSPYHSVLIQLP